MIISENMKEKEQDHCMVMRRDPGVLTGRSSSICFIAHAPVHGVLIVCRKLVLFGEWGGADFVTVHRQAALTDKVNVRTGWCLTVEQALVNCSVVEEGTFTYYVIGGGKR